MTSSRKTYVIWTKHLKPTKGRKKNLMAAWGGIQGSFKYMDDAQEIRCYKVNIMHGHVWNHDNAASKLKDELMLNGNLTPCNEKWPDGRKRWVVNED